MGRSREIRLIVGICTALALLIWAVIGSLVSVTRDREIEDAYRDAAATSRIFAEQVGRTIRGIETVLAFVAYELAKDPSPDKIAQLVNSGVVSMNGLVQIAFTDAEGRVVGANTGPDTAKTLVADREHIRVQLDNPAAGLFISRPVLGRVSRQWSIQISRRLERPDGTLLGVVVASLDPFFFERFWQRILPGPKDSVELIGLDGYLRTRAPETEWALSAGIDRKSIVTAAANAPSARFAEVSPDGLDRLSFYQTLSDFPLIVISGYARSAVLENVASLTRMYLGVGAIVTLIIASLGAWLSYLARRLGRQEQEAILANRRLCEAVEVVSEGFALFDSEDRLILANEAFKSHYPRVSDDVHPGVTYASIVRKGVAEGQWPDASEDPQGWANKIIHRHQHPGEPYELQTADGRWLRVSERATAEGGIVGIRTDISAMKAREEALVETHRRLEEQAVEVQRLARAAQQASAAKSAFVAAISHEIRTPLNAVIGYSGLLRKTQLDAEQAGYANIIESSAQHLLGMIGDVLDFSQIEAGRLTLHVEPFEIAEMMEKLRRMTAVLLGDKPVEFVTSIAPEAPPVILGDPVRLYQVLLNIVGNAAKFTEKGRICVDLKVSVSARGEASLLFCVDDTGIGLSDDAKQRLFVPFEQGDVKGEMRAAGTGLGLAISRRLVELMEGEIGVKSEAGTGARFWFTVPLRIASASMRDGDRAETSTPALNILVADDVPSLRMLVKLLLEKRGHKVLGVADGEAAVAAVREGCFDAVLLDLQMPKMGGLEAAREIRALPKPAGDVPVFALTAQVLEDDRRAALEAGMNGFLTKPFRERDLVALLDSLKQTQAS